MIKRETLINSQARRSRETAFLKFFYTCVVARHIYQTTKHSKYKIYICKNNVIDMNLRKGEIFKNDYVRDFNTNSLCKAGALILHIRIYITVFLIMQYSSCMRFSYIIENLQKLYIIHSPPILHLSDKLHGDTISLITHGVRPPCSTHQFVIFAYEWAFTGRPSETPV